MKTTFSLKENRDFRRLYHRGRSAATPYLVVYVAKNRLNYNRLGLTVSVKLGGAVQRNRAKRLLREAFRLCAKDLPCGFDFVLVARARTINANCFEVKRAFKQATKTLKLNKNSVGEKNEKVNDKSN